MEVVDQLATLSREQLVSIAHQRSGVPYDELNAFAQAQAKARVSAVHFNKDTWSILQNTYVNAVLQSIRRVNLNNPLQTVSIVSAVENVACAILGRDGLTFEEFNLCVGPVASVIAPSLFAEKQSWQVIPFTNTLHRVPYYPAGWKATATRTRARKEKEPKTEEPLSLADQLLQALAGKKEEPEPDVAADPDIADMLAIISGQPRPVFDNSLELAVKEGVRLNETHGSEISFELLTAESGVVIKTDFATSIDAVTYAMSQGWEFK